MNLEFRILLIRSFTGLVLLGCALSGKAQQIPSEYQGVLQFLGKQGDFKANVFKINIPRNDLQVKVDDEMLPAPFGFSGWLAMTKGDGGQEVMMGDLVLVEEEVNPVLSALLDNGLEVTALHNHFFRENPRMFYMHVMGHGTAAELARQAKPALDLIGHQSLPQRFVGGGIGTVGEQGRARNTKSIDTSKIAHIVGVEGEQNGDVYKITVGRDDLSVKEMGALINARMGLNSWAAFAGTGDRAAIAGDIAMLDSEVQSVLKALRKNDLEIVAIHHHMIGVNPPITFLHYWGEGMTDKLAAGFRAALDELGKKNSSLVLH